MITKARVYTEDEIIAAEEQATRDTVTNVIMDLEDMITIMEKGTEQDLTELPGLRAAIEIIRANNIH
jgi:hypothetical protein